MKIVISNSRFFQVMINSIRYWPTNSLKHNIYLTAILFIIGLYFLYNLTSFVNPRTKDVPEEIIEYVNLRNLLIASIYASEKGGLKVFKIREDATLHEKSKGKTDEGANDPVTEGDMQSHREMYFSLKKSFPSINIISEEKDDHDKGIHSIDSTNVSSTPDVNDALKVSADEYVPIGDVQIWIDPLDATQEYTENLLEYVTTMVCVAVRGVPTIGVIHKPFENFTAWAWVGKAHNPKIEVDSGIKKKPKEKEPIKVIVSRSHRGSVVENAQAAFGEDVKVTGAGGAGFKTLEVLSGRQDLYFHSSLIKKWDICAGNALLNHFGGRMTTRDGHDLNYSDASSPKNDGGLVAALHNHMFYLQKIRSS